jgi:hypothetical protein
MCIRWGVFNLLQVIIELAVTAWNDLIRILRLHCLFSIMFCRSREMRFFLTSLWTAVLLDMNPQGRQTPATLFLGRYLSDPLNIRWKVTVVLGRLSDPSLVELWTEELSNLRQARGSVAQKYNKGRSANPFKPGDQMLVRLNPLSSHC